MSITAIKIFDTTLRDGQQCPGAGMSRKKNIEYAELAAQAGVDILEAGFPAASQLDFDIVHTIATRLAAYENGPVVAALCQLREQQIDRTIEALTPALKVQRARLHTYLPVDPNLMQASLGKVAGNQVQFVDQVFKFVQKAVTSGLEVEFSPEGYSRMGENFAFVTDLIRAAVSGGAQVINCPDTIGGGCKLQGDEYFVEKMKQHAKILRQEFPNKDLTWSVHCHNDFGLALENTMQGIFNGPATQIEGCFNGIGERAGNVPLEQCIMYIKHFGSIGERGQRYVTRFDIHCLQAISDFINDNMLNRQAHWPITGSNAAKHSSGGHTNAVLKNPLAYQPFDPVETGKQISFLFGPLSGGNLAKSIIEANGYRCDDSEKAQIAQFIKQYYADRRKGITDEELIEAYLAYRHPINVSEINYQRMGDKSALHLTGQFFSEDGSLAMYYQGNDSVLAALNQEIAKHMDSVNIENYMSEAVNKGINAVNKSTIIISVQEKHYTGMGEDNDIEVSALKALIHAVNKAYVDINFKVEGL